MVHKTRSPGSHNEKDRASSEAVNAIKSLIVTLAALARLIDVAMKWFF